MRNHEIASLASKLLGLYFAVHSVGYLSALGSQLSLTSAARVSANQLFLYTVSLSCFAFTLCAGLFLIFRASRVSTLLVGTKESDERSSAVRSRNIQVIAFSTVGLIMCLQSFPHLINLTVNYWFSREGWLYRSGPGANAYIDFITSLIQLGLGIWLLLGATAVAGLVNRVRGDFEEE